MAPARDGIPEWIAPIWIDTSQTPQRNTYWRLQRELLQPPPIPR